MENFDNFNINESEVLGEEFERMVFKKYCNLNVVDSMLSRIRNSLAHGRFGMFKIKSKEYFWIEDKHVKLLTMRGIISKYNLLEIISIVSRKP